MSCHSHSRCCCSKKCVKHWCGAYKNRSLNPEREGPGRLLASNPPRSPRAALLSRATAGMSSERSTPVTGAQRSAASREQVPSPQPASGTRFPFRGARRSSPAPAWSRSVTAPRVRFRRARYRCARSLFSALLNFKWVKKARQEKKESPPPSRGGGGGGGGLAAEEQ